MSSVPVNLMVHVGRGLSEHADMPSFRTALRESLNAELQRIGVPGIAKVRVGETDGSRAFRIRLQGQLQPYSPGLLAVVWQDIAPAEEHHWIVSEKAAEDVFPDAWLTEALASMDGGSRAERLEAVGVALTLALVRRALPTLLNHRVIEAYIDRLAPEARAQISPQEWEAILPALIELTGTLADDGLVTAALNARSVGVNTQDMAEYIYAWLPHADIEVLAHPDYLAYLHGEPLEGAVSMRAPRTPDLWGNQYEQLETALFQVLGLPMPDVLFVPTADLAPGHLQVRVGGTPGVRVRGLDPNELLVRQMGEATAALGDRVDATITIDPSTGLPALLMNEGARLELEEAGIAYADARRVVIDVVIGELRAQRRRLLAIEDLDHQLSALRMAFPSLFQAAMASFALPDLVRIARMLVDEDVAIWNLRMVLSRLLEYDVGPPAEDGSVPAPTLAAYADFIRAGLADLFAGALASNGGVAVIRVDRGLERQLATLADSESTLSDQKTETIRDATWALWDSDGLADRSAVVVTTGAARRPLRDVLRPEFPSLTVLANSELPLRVERQTVGTIVA